MRTFITTYKILLFTFTCLILSNSTYGQSDSLKNRLAEIAESELSTLNNTITLSVSNLNVGELVRAITRETGVNVYIPNRLNTQVTSNFSGVKVKDIIYYLCVEYNLQCDIVGNIIRLTSIPEPIPLKPEPEISYNELTGTITYNINNNLVEDVAKRITDLTGINIIPSQSVKNILSSGFGKNVSIEDALIQIGFVNGFTVRKIKDNQLVLVPIAQQTVGEISDGSNNNFGFSSRDIALSIDERGLVEINVANADLQQLFTNLMQKAGITYKILNPIVGTVSLSSTKITIKDCLYRMFKGTTYTYRMEGNICFAGTRDNPGLKYCKLIELDYRSAEALNKQLPASYISGVEWMDFPEMNAIILFGDSDRLNEIESFIRSIDKRVPVILIDVIIADISKNLSFDWMFDIGIGTKPTQTSGTIISGGSDNAGMNMSFGASSINTAMNKLGLSSIGKVSPNFYANLRMMEENGWAKVRSTPRLSTLNSKEATLKIGRTEYYKEEMNSYYGSMDPQLSTQTVYKAVDAELSVTIRPIVSGDGSVTVAVEVIQSDFTERVSEYGPPGLMSRSFKSEIQVNNDEMILLGGLEESTNSETNRGVPFISRVPVLKWFFGGKSKVKNETQLTIFIKPTIIN